MHLRRKYCGALQPVDKVIHSDPLAVGSDLVSPVRSVRDLGIFIDAILTMRTYPLPRPPRHVRSVLLPFYNYEAYVDLCQTT